MVDKYVGECPVCGNFQRLKNDRLLVNHGYTRPTGWYQNMGTCFGAGLVAYELSSDGVKEYIRYLEDIVPARALELKQLTSGKVDSITIGQKPFHPYDSDWPTALRQRIYERTRELEQLDAGIQEMRLRLKAWKARPLQTAAAREANERSERQVSTSTRVSEKEAKLAVALERKWKIVEKWRPLIEALLNRGWQLDASKGTMSVSHLGHRLLFKSKEVLYSARPTLELETAYWQTRGKTAKEIAAYTKQDQLSWDFGSTFCLIDEPRIIFQVREAGNVRQLLSEVDRVLKA